MTIAKIDFDLDAKYRATEGEILVNGVQALVRIVFDQLRADHRRGLNTAAFVSGYPGSPLGGFDIALSQSGSILGELGVEWIPGVNEDLAVGAVWGSQQDNLAPLKRHDGVIGMWYGKAPGVDRSGDALRHANLHGPGRNGGVVCAVGDDPQSKSSTLPSASEIALYDAGLVVLAPGTSQEILDLGRHAFELSRYAGVWSALKIVTAVADGFATATVHPDRITPVRPELSFDGVPWAFRQVARLFLPDTVALEQELFTKRLEAARAYARENGVDVMEVDPGDAWITIVSYGHTYREVRQALSDLGLATDDQVRDAGIRLLRLGMISPLDPSIIRRAAAGVEELLVIEDKRSFVEQNIRDLLYDDAVRPRVTGKRDDHDRPLVPVDGEMTSDRIRPVLTARLRARLTNLPGEPVIRTSIPITLTGPPRSATFCSGCPHNRSTVEASGDPVGGGVGCHTMTLWLDRGIVGYTHMGGEGAAWIGRSRFTDVDHFVQNVGDGTFFHSASLSIRAAVAAGTSMTFKLLYNGVVAMTGGQDPVGQLDIPHLCTMLQSEGVARTIVVSDDPDRLIRSGTVPRDVSVWPRDRLADAECALAKTPGTTVLIYDQACAAELRRLRKRGRAPERSRRVMINEAVCEGCGDCGVKSNCLSVHPVDTDLGRKTQIHQASCNTDYSCLDGDCPSFVTVDAPASGVKRPGIPVPADIPEPPVRATAPDSGYRIMITGIGGTGIVTVNQLVATAAFLDGLKVAGLDQTGLSQKGGPVVSHLVLAPTAPQASNAVGPGAADLFLALDLLVATDPRFVNRASADRTTTIASTSMVPTGDMVRGDTALPGIEPLLDVLRRNSRPDGLVAVDLLARTEAVNGDAISANVFALGVAYQAGALPISVEALERAIEINGVAIDRNLAAFRAGRWSVHDPARLPGAARPGALVRAPRAAALDTSRGLATARGLVGDSIVVDTARRRAAELIDYQNAALAGRYLDLVAATAAAEHERVERDQLTAAVVDSYFHVLAYKDEYEVARLHLLAEFDAALDDAIPHGKHLRYWLHPPLLRAMGMKRKLRLPGWVARPAFRGLRAMRRLRGTPFDLVGYNHVRRTERRLGRQYEAEIRAVLGALSPATHAAAVELALLPLEIRGYESIKLAAVERYDAALATVRPAALGHPEPATV